MRHRAAPRPSGTLALIQGALRRDEFKSNEFNGFSQLLRVTLNCYGPLVAAGEGGALPTPQSFLSPLSAVRAATLARTSIMSDGGTFFTICLAHHLETRDGGEEACHSAMFRTLANLLSTSQKWAFTLWRL
ncbi:hypothetical protein EYF80_050505 [Liparis tanakae]|uniref:Uncharacterized protein n=1 Tax=Liparis tanakae TaxID=230148 RepID=A0A4Z2FEN3_9TELE|nr:hypothetical protein EYF80_050505 [Liparis tanakae]